MINWVKLTQTVVSGRRVGGSLDVPDEISEVFKNTEPSTEAENQQTTAPVCVNLDMVRFITGDSLGSMLYFEVQRIEFDEKLNQRIKISEALAVNETPEEVIKKFRELS